MITFLITFLIIKLNNLLMGAVSSMCCESDKKSQIEQTLPKPTKTKVEKTREVEIKKNP